MRKELDSHPQPQMRKKTESACDMVLLSRWVTADEVAN
jgi:hypothetical protein